MTHEDGDILGDQVALITGGSRGIGLAAGRALGLLGATVVLVGQTKESGEQAAQTLISQGIDALGLGVNVADFAKVSEVIGQHPIACNADILINSAGVMSDKMAKTLRTSKEEWDRVLGVNLGGVFNVTSAVVPQMVTRRQGRVINVSACLGRFTGPGLAGGLAPYRISKTAVNALTKNLAAELGHGSRGVLVDAMCPNHTRTDMGGPDAPRSPEEAIDTIVWLATREHNEQTQTGLLWEDRQVVPW